MSIRTDYFGNSLFRRTIFSLFRRTLGVLVYKEPSWKYTFPISHPHTRDLHFTPSNFFLLVISLTYLSLFSFSSLFSLLSSSTFYFYFFQTLTRLASSPLVSSSSIFSLCVLISSCSSVFHLLLLSFFFSFSLGLLSLFITSQYNVHTTGDRY